MIEIENRKGLPVEYESFLVEKYESYVTTCRYVEIFYGTFEINYLLVHEDGRLIDLLIFGTSGNTSKCFNLFAEFDQRVLGLCVKRQFDEYPGIQKIEVGASYKKIDLPNSFLQDKTNDQVVKLPTSIDDYFAALGYSTRKNARRQKKKLLTDYPQTNFVIRYGSEIDKSVVEKVLTMNEIRMKEKGIVYKSHFALDDIYRFLQHYGVAVYIDVDGVIVAGTISSIINKRIFALVVGHDSNFSQYSVGLMVQFVEMQEFIEKGLTTVHFLWGDNDYKKRLLGTPRALFSYQIYRNYSFDFILNKCKAQYRLAYIKVKQSVFFKPVRELVKLSRRRL
ncbi:MAG: GNAT family N-acetyltransferase [Paludibacter sp.]